MLIGDGRREFLDIANAVADDAGLLTESRDYLSGVIDDSLRSTMLFPKYAFALRTGRRVIDPSRAWVLKRPLENITDAKVVITRAPEFMKPGLMLSYAERRLLMNGIFFACAGFFHEHHHGHSPEELYTEGRDAYCNCQDHFDAYPLCMALPDMADHYMDVVEAMQEQASQFDFNKGHVTIAQKRALMELLTSDDYDN